MFFTIVLGFIAFSILFTLFIRKSINAAVFGLSSSFIIILFAVSLAFSIVPAGHVGVVDLFGKVSDETLKPGLNFKNPLAKVVKLSTKTQEHLQKARVPSKEGLLVHLEISILFHLSPEKASAIYKTVGPFYRDVILIPQVRSVIRTVTAQYEAKALYTDKREELASKIKNQISDLVADRGIVVEATPLRDVSLPAKLAEAIEEKLKAEQESQRMQFILEKERREAERKTIEAKGIADFQRIVTRGISKELLQWKGIEATEKLANSQNSKMVIIGSGKSGLPVILNQN